MDRDMKKPELHTYDALPDDPDGQPVGPNEPPAVEGAEIQMCELCKGCPATSRVYYGYMAERITEDPDMAKGLARSWRSDEDQEGWALCEDCVQYGINDPHFAIRIEASKAGYLP